jgi:hypothetical protein
MIVKFLEHFFKKRNFFKKICAISVSVANTKNFHFLPQIQILGQFFMVFGSVLFCSNRDEWLKNSLFATIIVKYSTTYSQYGLFFSLFFPLSIQKDI